MDMNITLTSLKNRYREAIARGDRIDRADIDRPKVLASSSSYNDKNNENTFLTQREAVRSTICFITMNLIMHQSYTGVTISLFQMSAVSRNLY
jgi:hypothetical protein